VSGQAVLRNAGDAVRRGLGDALLGQAGRDHVPAKGALTTDEGADAEELGGGAGGDALLEEEVWDREEEGEADDAAEEAVGPLIVVDPLELAHGDILVQAVAG
jgi:hypothetical protein